MIERNGTQEAANVPDTKVEWYDFGGGFTITPTPEPKDTDGPDMAALYCVKNGSFYFKVITGMFTKEDLTSMFKEYAPVFEAEVEEKSKTQETQ